MMIPYQRLKVWQMSCQLALKIYQISKNFPKYELFGITSQMRRAAVSIASNIAEGAERKNPKEFLNFISIAMGSLSELRTQSYLSQKLNYIDEESFKILDMSCAELSAALNALISSLHRSHDRFF